MLQIKQIYKMQQQKVREIPTTPKNILFTNFFCIFLTANQRENLCFKLIEQFLAVLSIAFSYKHCWNREQITCSKCVSDFIWHLLSKSLHATAYACRAIQPILHTKYLNLNKKRLFILFNQDQASTVKRFKAEIKIAEEQKPMST
jgi:hypothetical protein